MQRVLMAALAAVIAAGLLAGCGGSDSPAPAATREVAGTVTWPTGTTVTKADATVNLISSDGVSGIPAGTGTYDPATKAYAVQSVPTDLLAAVVVSDTSSGSAGVTLMAAIGSALGRSRATTTVDLSVPTTIAAGALIRRLQAGVAPSSLTPQMLQNLETAAATVSANTNVTDQAALVSAVTRLLTVTSNGASAGFGSALVGSWVAPDDSTVTIQSDGTLTLQAAGLPAPVSGVLTVTSATTTEAGTTYSVTVPVQEIAVPLTLALTENGTALTVSGIPGVQAPLVLTKSGA